MITSRVFRANYPSRVLSERATPIGQQVFAKLCEIVEEAIELYQQNGKPLPPSTSGKDYANKMLSIA